MLFPPKSFLLFSRELLILPSLCFKLKTNESYTAKLKIFLYDLLGNSLKELFNNENTRIVPPLLRKAVEEMLAAEAQYGSPFSCNFHYSSTLKLVLTLCSLR